MKKYQFWFVVGSQFLYGPETLEQVAVHAKKMVDELNLSDKIPCEIVLKPTIKTHDEALQIIRDANYSDDCAGIITWMHTFSPSKMWIGGFNALQKPYLHLHTQFNRKIPNEGIDMDFMNLNQSAHGDREHGFIATRMRLPRKVVVGFWQDEPVQSSIGSWMRSAVGFMVSKSLKVIRFGDNMREVAVTEGDKVETQIKLGWQVNTRPVGELVEEMDKVTDGEIDSLVDDYKEKYELATDDMDSIRYQARAEIAMKRILDREGAGAYTNTTSGL